MDLYAAVCYPPIIPDFVVVLSLEARDAFFKTHRKSVQEEYEESITDALHEEIGLYEDLSSGIDIITDARHGGLSGDFLYKCCT